MESWRRGGLTANPELARQASAVFWLLIGRICIYFHCLNTVMISRELEEADSAGHEQLSLNIGTSAYPLFGGSL
jgi:hypothetical protein